MGFMSPSGEIQGSENTYPLMDRKRSYFFSLTSTKNTNWDTVDVHMSVAEYTIRKETGRFNTPVYFWGCTNPPKYHEDSFHTYRNCPKKRDTDVAEQAKQSIQEYDQITSMIGRIRGDQKSQGKRGHTSSIAVRSMFEDKRVHITRSWKDVGFGSLDHALLMCETIDPSTSGSERLACAGALKGKYER